MGCSLTRPTDATPVSLVNGPVCSVAWEGQRAPPAEQGVSTLTILHFNDVYNIEEKEKEPVGGAARFKTKLSSLQHLNPLVLFSGDALNPSNMSTVTQGKQMIPVLNSFNIQAAVYGNHDFDFGVEHLVWLAGETEFPWLMSNVREKKTGQLLANGHEWLIIPWAGKKIGLVGLVEWEWLVTLATIEPDEVDYMDYVECAQRIVPMLKEKGCDLLVALTHMRMPNDTRLASEVPELHLILAGHDHHYEQKTVGNTVILKSGSDFRELSQITVIFEPSSPRPVIEVLRHEVRSDVQPNPEIQAVVDHYLAVVEDGMQEEIGSVQCDLEGRFSYIRTQETNLGNLVTDVMRRATRADVALLNSGTFRSDTVHDAGVFRMKDLTAVLPMVDALTVLEVTGQQVLEALENGVSQYPKHEGRFPQVSGISFSFDPAQPSGRRVVEGSVRVGGEALQLSRTYQLCTKGYIALGKDGYDVFRRAKVLLNYEEGPILNSIVRNYFTSCLKSKDCPDGPTTSYGRLDAGPGGINPKVEGRIINVCSR